MTRKIVIGPTRHHNKAAETYVDVQFNYDSGVELNFSVPIVYRRTGLDLSDAGEISAYIESVYDTMHPERWDAWRNEQEEFWKTSKAHVTKPFFDILVKDVRWVRSAEFPPNNNPARRLQDIKELGYTIATRNVGREYEYFLLPIERGGETGYEYWSGRLRTTIMAIHRNYDAYEGRIGNPKHLLPDHKFPEIRWDRDTARDSLEALSAAEMQRDFQLLTNQRNQQKREVCRGCRQTGRRPYPMGIRFYYEGDERWPDNVPVSGKAAEAGCVGCGWYDLEAWRQALMRAATEGSASSARPTPIDPPIA